MGKPRFHVKQIVVWFFENQFVEKLYITYVAVLEYYLKILKINFIFKIYFNDNIFIHKLIITV